MTIGQRIKEARKKAGLTQRELAEKAGTATGTIQQYELGKRQPRIEQLQAIAATLGVSVSYLLSGNTTSQTFLTNGVHIYRSSVPFGYNKQFTNDPFFDDPLFDVDVLYQDEYVLIVVEKDSLAKKLAKEELEKIVDAFAPFREKKVNDVIDSMPSDSEAGFQNRMNAAFLNLNFSGKQEAVKRVEELTEIPRYRLQDAPEAPPDALEVPNETLGTQDTPTPPDAAEVTQKLEEGTP